jgi:hypothetical protein
MGVLMVITLLNALEKSGRTRLLDKVALDTGTDFPLQDGRLPEIGVHRPPIAQPVHSRYTASASRRRQVSPGQLEANVPEND